MQKSITRFEYHIARLQALLDKAATQKNPALYLYATDARTPLFMLEGLAKLYAGLHNPKKFTKIKEHFKLLEDALGAIDYYDTTAKALAANKKIPPAILTYLQDETREKIQHLNEILTDEKWLLTTDSRLNKISKKLNEAVWLKEADEVTGIAAFYGEAIYDINEFLQETKFHFDNMEADVHELRRKLRWLSIYPQALRGLVQLGKSKLFPRHLKKYCTPEITNSPFNKIADKGNANYVLLLEQNYFYSLSWMIAELGRLKDDGLHLIAVKEALMLTAGMDEVAAFKKAYQLLGKKQLPLETLLAGASASCKTYLYEHNLESLVIGIEEPASK